jgi:hypothetical protein
MQLCFQQGSSGMALGLSGMAATQLQSAFQEHAHSSGADATNGNAVVHIPSSRTKDVMLLCWCILW